MAESKRYYCEKCKKTRPAKEFYTSNDLTKYPNDGKLNLCKDCLTMHLDNWNSETYLYILQELDVPYVPEEWNSIMGKYCLDPSKVTGTTVLGRYLSRMKLSQYKNYRWKDSDFIQKVKNKDKTEAMRQLGYDQAAIDEAIAADPQAPVPPPPPTEPTLPPVDPNEELANQIEAALVADLTEEDRKYLCLKWGKGYNPDEWIRLEELYKQMLDSYEIEQAGDLNTLKLACKASLKANQLLDIGDGSQKLA